MKSVINGTIDIELKQIFPFSVVPRNLFHRTEGDTANSISFKFF